MQVPEPLIQKEFSRIMSLKDGSKKMSKSELSDLSRVNLTDNKDQIINKIKKAKTDPLPMPKTIKELDERLEAKNLIGIYSSLTNSTMEKSVQKFAGKNFSEFKDKLSLVLVDKIEPISFKILSKIDSSYINPIMKEKKATISVWMAPSVNGRSYFVTIMPVKIICVLQNRAPNITKVSPSLTVAS